MVSNLSDMALDILERQMDIRSQRLANHLPDIERCKVFNDCLHQRCIQKALETARWQHRHELLILHQSCCPRHFLPYSIAAERHLCAPEDVLASSRQRDATGPAQPSTATPPAAAGSTERVPLRCTPISTEGLHAGAMSHAMHPALSYLALAVLQPSC